MIIEEIKNSIRSALNKADNDIIFHFEEIKHTGFPYAILCVRDCNIVNSSYNKKECSFSLELYYMKSQDNGIKELFESQSLLSKALLPTISINNKRITPDEVSFSIADKKLLMKFKLHFYVFEKDEGDIMETLDITIKEK